MSFLSQSLSPLDPFLLCSLITECTIYCHHILSLSFSKQKKNPHAQQPWVNWSGQVTCMFISAHLNLFYLFFSLWLTNVLFVKDETSEIVSKILYAWTYLWAGTVPWIRAPKRTIFVTPSSPSPMPPSDPLGTRGSRPFFGCHVCFLGRPQAEHFSLALFSSPLSHSLLTSLVFSLILCGIPAVAWWTSLKTRNGTG